MPEPEGVSVVLPVSNERDNLEPLQARLTEALKPLGHEYEDYANTYPEEIERHSWTLARDHHVQRLLRRAPGSGGLVLDIGWGRGITVEYLRGHGFDCRGSKLSDVAILAHRQAHCASSSDAFSFPRSCAAESAPSCRWTSSNIWRIRRPFSTTR